MFPVRLAVILLASLLVALGAAPSAFAQQGRQRRVFTNEDVAVPAPAPESPAAKPATSSETAAAPAGTAAASAEKAAGTESAAGTPAPAEQPGEAPPPGGLALAQFLQGILRRFNAEFAEKLDQETDSSRQTRWRTMMDLTMQLMTQNQLYISELDSQAKAAAPPGNPESPSTPATPPTP